MSFDLAQGLLLTRFVQGSLVTSEAIRQPRTLERVLRLLHDFHHDVKLESSSVFTPLRLAKNYLTVLRSQWPEAAKKGPADLDTLFAEASKLDMGLTCADADSASPGAASILASSPSHPLHTMHNDIVPSNLMDDGKRLWLLDYEYCGMGDSQYDLANLAVMNNFSPSEEALLMFLYRTVEGETKAALQGQTDLNRVPVADVSACDKARFTAMKALTLLKEGMWGLVQNQVARESSESIQLATAWTSHTDFHVYGLDFLRRVSNIIQDAEYPRVLQTLQSCCHGSGTKVSVASHPAAAAASGSGGGAAPKDASHFQGHLHTEL